MGLQPFPSDVADQATTFNALDPMVYASPGVVVSSGVNIQAFRFDYFQFLLAFGSVSAPISLLVEVGVDDGVNPINVVQSGVIPAGEPPGQGYRIFVDRGFFPGPGPGATISSAVVRVTFAGAGTAEMGARWHLTGVQEKLPNQFNAQSFGIFFTWRNLIKVSPSTAP